MTRDPDDADILAPIAFGMEAGPVGRVIRYLQSASLSASEGTSLGSEELLLEKLEVSRPTLIQAARVLEYQGLLAVRRGPGGGYFARRPDIGPVAQMAALYLRSRNTTLTEMLTAAHSFNLEAVSLAARSQDEMARRELRSLVREQTGLLPEDVPAGLFLQQDTAMTEIVYRLVGNEPLALIIRIFNYVSGGSVGGNIFDGYPERRGQWRPLRLSLARAILDRDGDRSIAVMRLLNEMSRLWARSHSTHDDGAPLRKEPKST